MTLIKAIKKIFTKWIPIAPIALIVPKKNDLIICIECDKGAWRENVKYFYLYLIENKKNALFLTEDAELYRWLQEKNLPSIFHESLKSYYYLLRAKIVVLSSSSLQKTNKYYLTLRARKVQLWHGLGIKRFELMEKNNSRYLSSLTGKVDNFLRGKFINHDVTVSTSDKFTEDIFSKTIRSKKYLVSGYPRNDYLLSERDYNIELLYPSSTSYNTILQMRNWGLKIVLYAPTFRKNGNNAISFNSLDLQQLSEYAVRENLVFVFKFHAQNLSLTLEDKYENLICFESDADIQPLMKIADILITDYSSVYFDYLLLERPILFFAYDLKVYLEQDRGFLLDYNQITPGPKCKTPNELLHSLKIFLEKPNWYAADRVRVRKLAYKYTDKKASDRIWNHISNFNMD